MENSCAPERKRQPLNGDRRGLETPAGGNFAKTGLVGSASAGRPQGKLVVVAFWLVLEWQRARRRPGKVPSLVLSTVNPQRKLVKSWFWEASALALPQKKNKTHYDEDEGKLQHQPVELHLSFFPQPFERGPRSTSTLPGRLPPPGK